MKCVLNFQQSEQISLNVLHHFDVMDYSGWYGEMIYKFLYQEQWVQGYGEMESVYVDMTTCALVSKGALGIFMFGAYSLDDSVKFLFVSNTSVIKCPTFW